MGSNKIAMCQRSESIWAEYCAIFKRRWDMDREHVIDIGCAGKTLFAAEFKEHGARAYSDSITLPIRNACYMASKMEGRWESIRNFDIKPPILDYGCGVGFQLLWLDRIGFSGLYGHELPGIQREIMLEAFKPHGIKPWGEGEPVETVLCMNVLEHLPEPVKALQYLKTIGNRVVANVCLDTDDEPHIAPMAERMKCAELLRSWGTLYE
jgi:hypothetical protein